MIRFFSKLFHRDNRLFRQHLNSAIGCYFPAFFEMNLDICGDLDINKLKDKKFALFLHEYTHFIQDVSTYYGLSNLFAVNEVIKSIHMNLTTSLPNGGKFKVPVCVMPNNSILKANNQLLSITFGTCGTINCFEVHDVDTKQEVVPNNNYLNQIDKVYVTTKSGEMFQFGSLAIMENMAYLMEQICVSECEPSPDYPYSAAEKVATYEAPSIGNNKLMVLALCDVSLQASNPGYYFYETLELVRKGAISYTKPEDVYDDFYNRNVVTYHASTIPNYLSQFRNMANAVINQEKKFIATPALSAYWKWIENAINYSYDLRLNHRCFLIDIAKSKDARKSKGFADFIKAVGTPLMMNKCGKFYYIPSQNVQGEGMCYHRAMRQVFRLLASGKKECDMRDWCKKSKIKVDCRCNSSPWKRLQEKEKCPYAVIWGSFNLGGYEPE